MENVLACKRQDTHLVKKSRSLEGQAQVLMLQALGHTCGATWFKNSKGSRNGRRSCTPGLDQELFQPAPWVAEGLRPGFKKRSWKNLKRQDLVHIATRKGKDKLSETVRRRVTLAWSWIKGAKKDGLQSVPQMYRLLCLAPTREMPSPPALRAQMVERLGCLTLETGLYVGPSTIPDGGYGLFTRVPIAEGTVVTYYDGVAYVLDRKKEQEYGDRSGWFIAVSLTSKNQGVIAGFTSMDLPVPASAGVVSLMNSSPDSNCRKDVIERIDRPLLMIGGSPVTRVPTVVASKDIAPDTELLWDYPVKHNPLGADIARRAQCGQ